MEKEVDAGLIGGLAAGAVDIDIDAFVAHLQADGAEPAAAATLGLASHRGALLYIRRSPSNIGIA